MPDGYDFSEDEEVLQEQRDAAKWGGATEKEMAGELGSLNTRVSACALQLSRMISDNDYTKTKDMLDALLSKDLGTGGWLYAFYSTNTDAFSKYIFSEERPNWYKELKPEDKKQYETGLTFYRDVKYLLNIAWSLFNILRDLRLEAGFKLARVRFNFESADFDSTMYKKVDQDVRTISDFLNRDWGELERNVHSSKSFLEANLGKLPKRELERGYRAERLADFHSLVRSCGLSDSFVEHLNGDCSYYSVRPDLLVKAGVIDRYTHEIAYMPELKEPMQKTMDDCKKVLSEEVAEADKHCTTQAGQWLCSAFQGLVQYVYDFAEARLLDYVNFKEAKNIAPYCFMKKLSPVKPKYAFQPDSASPWDCGGTSYEALYRSAAEALGSQARLFAYDHGATIF